MQLAAPQSAPDTYPITTAAVPVFETFQGGNAGGGNAEGGPSAGAAAAPAPDVNYQASLFRDPLSAKVVPIPTLTSSREVQRDAAPRRAPRSASPRTSGRRASLSHRDSQQRLDFEVLSPLDTQMEAVISCDAPVALPTHRMIAAAMDLSIVVIALGVCFGIFLVAGGAASFTRQNLPLFLGVGVALEVLYRLLWVLGNGDSPGLRFAGLRIVDFDGRPPTREQRALRQVASLLSVLSAGLGLVWALVDEENLTWHDHISKTFPTPG